MPTYDYECLKCGYNFEVFQEISESSLEVCPQCKGKLRKLPSAGCGLIFKGSGFYITDYKRTSQKETLKGETSGKREEVSSSSNKNKEDHSFKENTFKSTNKIISDK